MQLKQDNLCLNHGKLRKTYYLCGCKREVNLFFRLLNVFSIWAPFGEFAGESPWPGSERAGGNILQKYLEEKARVEQKKHFHF